MAQSQTTTHPYIASALRTIDVEAQALLNLKPHLGASFIEAVNMLFNCTGRIVVIGMGKSGHIARKTAATLSSTGTPAFFVHAGEASHGDLGMITGKDVVLALSNSGESDELAAILPPLNRMQTPVIALTGQTHSTLAKYSTIVIHIPIEAEACPLNLAPTASTAAQLAIGDALAIACLERRGFQAEDFAKSHPGGTLGRKLLTLVKDVMRPLESLPIIKTKTSVIDAMTLMSQSGLGLVIEVSQINHIVGIFTDGDLRRAVVNGVDLKMSTVNELMRANPKTINLNALAVDAAQLMEQSRITSVVVVDKSNAVVGALNTNDLLRAKVI
jgi:arabinose-5-phosphate isomerase